MRLNAEKKTLTEMPKSCLWCKTVFYSYHPHQIFCSQKCGQEFHAVKDRIGSRHFELDFRAEYAKLEELGKNYVIPEHRELEEDSENEE